MLRFRTIRSHVPAYLSTVLVIGVFLLHCLPVAAQDAVVFRDNAYYFSVQLPAGWLAKHADDQLKSWRGMIVSPEQKSSINFMAFKFDQMIDLEKFADYASKAIPALGQETASETVSQFFQPIAVHKRYGPDSEGRLRMARYQINGNFGYAMICTDASGQFDSLLGILGSFAANPPLGEKVDAYINKGVLLLFAMAACWVISLFTKRLGFAVKVGH